MFLGYYFDFKLVLKTRSNKYTQFTIDQITKRLHANELESQEQVASAQKPGARNQQVLN